MRLVTREEAWPTFKQEYGEISELNDLTINPLPDKLEIVTIAPEKNMEVAARLGKLPEFDKVVAEEKVLQRLLAIGRLVRSLSLALAGLLALGTAAVIGNAIRVTLFARRRDLEVMQLVGATDNFIRFPFVLEGAVEGALGATLAAGLTLLGLRYLQGQIVQGLPFVGELHITISEPLLAGTLVTLGILAGTVGSLASLRRFLRA